MALHMLFIAFASVIVAQDTDFESSEYHIIGYGDRE